MVDPKKYHKEKISNRNTRAINYNNRARSYERSVTSEINQQIPVIQTINGEIQEIQKRGRIVSHQINLTKHTVNSTNQTYIKIATLKAGETLKHVIACNKQDNNGTYGYSGADSAAALYLSLAYGYSNIDNLDVDELIEQQNDVYHIILGRGIEAGNNVDLLNVTGKDTEAIERHIGSKIEYTFDKDVFIYLRNHTTYMVDLTLVIK